MRALKALLAFAAGASVGLGATFVYFACHCEWFTDFGWLTWW